MSATAAISPTISAGWRLWVLNMITILNKNENHCQLTKLSGDTTPAVEEPHAASRNAWRGSKLVVMQRIGLTGGIAAGKSTASAQFAKLGAVVIDYDQLSRDAVAPGSPVLTCISEVFGPEFIDDDGALNRQVMADRIFTDPAARQTLESLIHPRVFELASEIEADANRQNSDVIVIHDIPLLVEKNLGSGFDTVIIVHANEAIREKRLIESRGLSPAEARARIKAGATDDERQNAGTHFLDGNASPENLQAQVTDLWNELKGLSM
jgi:dephospho-CoA kinase